MTAYLSKEEIKRKPLARALVTIHLQQMRDQEALP